MTPPRQDPNAENPDQREPRRRAWRDILRLHALLTPLMDEELRTGSPVDLNTYDAMLHIFEAGEFGLQMNALAKRIVMSRSGLTSVVDRLEQRGLVERRPDPDDRRATRICLTEEGEAIFREAAKVHFQSIDQHFLSHLTEQEATTIVDVIERIIDHHTAQP